MTKKYGDGHVVYVQALPRRNTAGVAEMAQLTKRYGGGDAARGPLVPLRVRVGARPQDAAAVSTKRL